MTQTKTKGELNEIDCMRRHTLKMSRRNSCIESFTNIYMNTLRFKWDRDKLNQSRIEMWESDTFRSLPGSWQEFVRGAVHVLSSQFEKQLVWTHIHPRTGKRLRGGHKSLDKLHSQINTDYSCFCYEPEEGQFVPIDKEHRDLDKKIGILE